MGFGARERRRNERKKAFGGDLWALCVHPCAVPLCIPMEKQQLNPGHSSCPLPTPLAWCRDTHKNLQQIPPSRGENLCPQEKGHLKGCCWVATQVQHGFEVAGFHPGSHGGFEGGQGKLSPLVLAMEILALRGVRAFRVRDQPGHRLETPTKHGEQSPVSRLASRTAGGRDTYPTHSLDKAHLPISEKNEMGLEGRVRLQRCRGWR